MGGEVGGDERACYLPIGSGACLVPGRYSAQVQFRYTPDGGPVYDIYYPVVMDVVP